MDFKGLINVNNDGANTDSITWTDLSSGSNLTSITGFQMKIMNGGGLWVRIVQVV